MLVKLFFEEQHSNAAVRLVKNASRLMAPDLMWAEAANVVWKRLRRNEIATEEASGVVEEMLRVPIVTASNFDLVDSAIALAAVTGRTVYDCLYLALAIRENMTLLTGDERFVNGLADTPYAPRVHFVGTAGR